MRIGRGLALRTDAEIRQIAAAVSRLDAGIDKFAVTVSVNLRGEGKLTAENMESALREIRMALLEADVNFRVVKQLIENIKAKAMGEEVLTALSPSQQVSLLPRRPVAKRRSKHAAHDARASMS